MFFVTTETRHIDRLCQFPEPERAYGTQATGCTPCPPRPRPAAYLPEPSEPLATVSPPRSASGAHAGPATPQPSLLATVLSPRSVTSSSEAPAAVRTVLTQQLGGQC